jgi:PleD family two-component response regulator
MDQIMAMNMGADDYITKPFIIDCHAAIINVQCNPIVLQLFAAFCVIIGATQQSNTVCYLF